MRPAAELLARVEALGVRLEARGDRLHYEGPETALTPSLLEELRAAKAGLLEVLLQHGDGEGERRHQHHQQVAREHPNVQRAQDNRVPVSEERLLYETREGTSVWEISQLDPPGPSRFEKRSAPSLWPAMVEETDDPLRAQSWVDGLKAWDRHNPEEPEA